ncbi:MAG: nicotinamide-nucleotide adenylyltransferase [Thermoplasmata archaeon]|nr:MAG: nicotinamide-nucleotide adenylyltransferase [Thermoplasmata archaeon]
MKPLFIGRFQPFHNAHLEIVRRFAPISERFIIGIGSSQLHHAKDNPFTFEERKRMIKASLDDEGIDNYEIYAIPDINNYPKWVAHVESIVPEFDLVLARNPTTIKLFEEKGYRVKTLPLFYGEECKGSEIRRKIVHDEDWQGLVPKSVAKVIREMDGIERIKRLYKE